MARENVWCEKCGKEVKTDRHGLCRHCLRFVIKVDRTFPTAPDNKSLVWSSDDGS